MTELELARLTEHWRKEEQVALTALTMARRHLASLAIRQDEMPGAQVIVLPTQPPQPQQAA